MDGERQRHYVHTAKGVPIHAKGWFRQISSSDDDSYKEDDVRFAKIERMQMICDEMRKIGDDIKDESDPFSMATVNIARGMESFTEAKINCLRKKKELNAKHIPREDYDEILKRYISAMKSMEADCHMMIRSYMQDYVYENSLGMHFAGEDETDKQRLEAIEALDDKKLEEIYNDLISK